MERKKGLITGIAVLLLIVLASGAYEIYRYFAASENLREEVQNDLNLTKGETNVSQASSEESGMPEEI